jgi:hypothetical protein
MNAYELADYVENTDCEYIQYFKVSTMLRQQADRIAELENPILQAIGMAFEKPLSDEEIYELWCEADNTELLPEMRLKDGSINYIITTFAKLIEERHGIK